METYGIEKFGIIGPKAVYRNLTPAQLTEAALRRGEGSLSNTPDVHLRTNLLLILKQFTMKLLGVKLTAL